MLWVHSPIHHKRHHKSLLITHENHPQKSSQELAHNLPNITLKSQHNCLLITHQNHLQKSSQELTDNAPESSSTHHKSLLRTHQDYPQKVNGQTSNSRVKLAGRWTFKHHKNWTSLPRLQFEWEKLSWMASPASFKVNIFLEIFLLTDFQCKMSCVMWHKPLCQHTPAWLTGIKGWK